MEPFTRITEIAVPVDGANVDTDQIIPAPFLRRPRSAGYPNFLFYHRRKTPTGDLDPDFPLNCATYAAAKIIVADENFGCGSSREPAVWALTDPPTDSSAPGPFRAIIAPSFGDIFYNNASKNGLLCVRLAADTCERYRRYLKEQPGSKITVDLQAQRVVGPDGVVHSFDIDPFRKDCLVRGLDDIGLTLEYEQAISEYEALVEEQSSWRLPCVPD